KHNDIMSLFRFNVTSTQSDWVNMYTTLAETIALCPIVVILLSGVGFAMVQSGASRVENAAFPFINNLLTMALSSMSVWSVGYAIAMSEGSSVIGFGQWFSHEFETQFSSHWLVQICICTTTAHIVTAGGLERCPLHVYCMLVPAISGFGCSLAIRWVWNSDGWNQLYCPFGGVAYRDYGGSGVIHVVGGASALVLTYVIGPRYSRIRRRDAGILYTDLAGHSIPLEMLGWYLTFICLLCCNCMRVTVTCISCQTIAQVISRAVINSLIASATTALFIVIITHIITTLVGRHKFHYLPSRVLANGAICGLAAVAAGCNVYAHWAAFVVGVTSSFGYLFWSELLHLLNVDDPVGAIAVHFGGGLWGVVCVQIFAEGSGLLFADSSSQAGLALLWNVLTALLLAVGSGILTILVLQAPRILHTIPLAYRQELQGLDQLSLKQHAYPDGSKDTPFKTEVIEDSECFVNVTSGSPQSPTMSVTSPTSFALFKSPNRSKLPGNIDLFAPFHSVSATDVRSLLRSPGVKSLPSFCRSPGYLDRRVWFYSDQTLVQNQVAPGSPVIDYPQDGDPYRINFCVQLDRVHGNRCTVDDVMAFQSEAPCFLVIVS
ncbi:hypothetical protein DPMN_012255, partial [Dreissena polymorpha]